MKSKLRLLHSGLMCSPNSNMLGGFSIALNKTFADVMEVPLDYQDWNTNIVVAAKAFKPDIVFLQIQNPGKITSETALALSELSYVMNWTGDVRQPIPQWFYEIGQYAHLTCFSNEHDVREFNKNLPGRSAYLQIGIDPEIYKLGYDKIKCPEIVFMGNNYDNAFPLSQARKDLVGVMRKHFGHRFAVFGNGWKGATSLMHSQPLEAQHYNSCKIAINYNHFDLDRFSSDRIFRIMASGAFCLSQHYVGIEKDFEVGKHLDAFKDFNELVQKCSYYLQNENERALIADEGYMHCRENFTFENMAKNIVELFNKHKYGK